MISLRLFDPSITLIRGLKVVKFFPAEQAGGIAMIKAMAAPYTMVKFMPTGGINTKNLALHLSADFLNLCNCFLGHSRLAESL